ncbi:MAG: phosphatase PAP2 family protein [Candidatus Marinimicrobia bacterium]|nr:phosphatase PAP2 family protein [Candidatus Neomarinimicrobiota bacterium]
MELIQFLQQFDFPIILFLMKGITLLGNGTAYPIYLIISFFYLNRKNWLSFLGIIILSAIIMKCLKDGFALARPPEELHLISVSGFGFPSGHAQMAMVVWGWLGHHYNRIIPASVMIFMVGFSRIYLGVHMLHQVIGGWAVGFVVFMGWIFVERELSKNS